MSDDSFSSPQRSDPVHPTAAAAIPSLWGINGVTSVLGSVAAMSLAKLAGYRTSLAVGAAVYLGVAAVVHRVIRRHSAGAAAPGRPDPSDP